MKKKGIVLIVQHLRSQLWTIQIETVSSGLMFGRSMEPSVEKDDA